MIRTISLLFSLILVSACSNDSRSNLFEAQICIDKIDGTLPNAELSTAVSGCLSKISGQQSEQAYILRCSGDFISQGITEKNLITAIKDLDEPNQATDPTITAMDTLAFDTVENANNAIVNCSESGSETLIALSNLANVATNLKILANTDLNNFVDNYNDGSLSSAEKIQLANTIIGSQSSLCEPGKGLMEGNEVCTNINAAVTQGTTTDAEKEALVNEFMSNLDK